MRSSIVLKPDRSARSLDLRRARLSLLQPSRRRVVVPDVRRPLRTPQLARDQQPGVQRMEPGASRRTDDSGYVTPKDKLLGNDAAIFAARDRKLTEARERRTQTRQTRHEYLETRADAWCPAMDFAAVRASITIAHVLVLLAFTPRSDHAGQQRGPCPLHGQARGTACCFSVNTQAHTFHCFKCGRSGNALELWAAAQRLSICDAAIDLCQRLSIPLPMLAPLATANREEEPVATG